LATAGVTGSAEPSSSTGASPEATVDEAFCGLIGALESKLHAFEAIKLKAANKAKVKQVADTVSVAFSLIPDAASGALKSKVNVLKAAVDALASAAENYATNPRPDAAATGVRKATTSMHRAITQLRAAANCAS
jgi:hypothetical protein